MVGKGRGKSTRRPRPKGRLRMRAAATLRMSATVTLRGRFGACGRVRVRCSEIERVRGRLRK